MTPEQPARLYEASGQTANDKLYRGSGYLMAIIVTNGGAAGGTIDIYDTDVAEGSSWAAEKKLIPQVTVGAGAITLKDGFSDFGACGVNVSNGLGLKASAADIVFGVYLSKRVQKMPTDPEG